MSTGSLIRPPAATNSVTGTPAAPNVSMIIRVPDAVDSSSALYISAGRVARVRPTMTPDRLASTSTDRLPPSQSSAIRPCAPGGWAAASAPSSSKTDTPRCAASSWTEAGTKVAMNQAKMSPTPLWPASYPHRPATIPPSTAPHMPGTSCRPSPFMTWHVEVPMIATSLPGTIVTVPAAGPGAQGSDYGMSELAFGEAGERRVELAEELTRRILAVLVDALVAGGAGVAGLGTAQLPDDPVRGLDPAIRPGVELGVFFQQLECLGELPLGRDLAAVPADPRLLAIMCQRVDPVRVRLGGVMLPQLRVGMHATCQRWELTERGSVGGDREAGGRGEVGGDANDLRGIDACLVERGGHRRAERRGPVGGGLQRPVRRQPGGGELGVDHAMRGIVYRGAQLCTLADSHHERARRQRAEVHSYHVHARGLPLLALTSSWPVRQYAPCARFVPHGGCLI